MSVAEAGAPAGRKDDALRYELRMALHALAGAVDSQPADAEHVQRLLRAVIDLGDRTLRGGPLPPRPFAYLGAGTPIGPGALLAEYADPGTTALTPLLAELDPDLLAELDALLTRSESAGHAAAPAAREPAGPDEVPLLLEPVAGWSAVARATVAFGDHHAAGTGTTPGKVRAAWTALPPAAAAEVERGLAAASRLMAEVGRPQPPAVSAFIDARGVLAPSQIAPHACAAAVALTYLARQGGLPTPGQLGVLPLAGCADDGTWTPFPGTGAALPESADDGLDLLWRTEEGWHLSAGTGTRTDPDPGLSGAARLLWGPDWEEARQGWAWQSLDDHAWRVLHATGGTGGDGAWLAGDGTLLVELDQAAFLAERFLRWPASRVIQSGTRNSGKTVCARQLTARLEAAGWQTVVLSPLQRHLPTDGTLPAVVQAALIATRAETSRKTLVVLEDLHALNGGNVGKTLESLGDLKVAVLALTRYVDGATSSWDSHGVTAYMTPLAAEEIARLARRLIDTHPAEYRAPDGEQGIPLAVEACQGDLGVLVDLLRAGVPDAPLGENGRRDAAGLVRRQAEEACAPLTGAAREAVCRLAAVSALDEGVPVSHLAQVPEETCRALGVRVTDEVARIPSGVRAEAVLTCVSPNGRDDLRGHLERYVRDALGEGQHERVRALMANCAAYAPVELAELLEDQAVRRSVTTWAAGAHTPAALRLLRLCGKHSDPGWIAEALPPVLARVPDTPDLTVRDLTTALKACWDHQYQLTGTEIADLFTWVGSPGLDEVLARPSAVRDRYHLVRALLRLSGENTAPTDTVCQWLEKRAEELVRGADPHRRHDDLIKVRRMDELIFRYSREARGPESHENRTRDRLRPLEKAAQTLLEAHPTRQTPLPAVLAWMSLWLHFNSATDWDDLIKRYESQIRAALAGADASQISSSLADLARNNRGWTNRLLNTLQPGRALAATLRASTPAEAAILISTVRNIHGATIKTLLYRVTGASPVADVQLARDLAASIRRLKDGRGAGMLLSSVSRADDLYCDTKDRFGYCLARELGPAFARELMATERRPAVIYHFLHGLWEAGADYRAELEDQALDLVVSSIQAQRGAARPWGPRLAMLLIEDDYFGQNFLLRLSERLDTRVLIERMRNAALDPQSMVHTHRLGLAVAPGIGAEYAKHLKVDRVVRNPLRWGAGEVAQKLQVTASTLRAGGQRDATAVVLGNFKAANPRWEWERNLRAVRRIGSFTTALNQLRKLDPSAAGSVVHAMSRPQGDQEVSDLTDMVIRGVVHPPLVADLLAAVERCAPGLGKRELAALRDERAKRWQTFTEIFKFEQDPITQGRIGQALARLGVMPDEEPKNWMGTLVNGVWSSTLPLLASPWAVREVVRLGYTWDAQWGEQLAEKVHAGRLLTRLRLRMRPDLRQLPDLLTVMWLTARDDIVADIVGELTDIAPAVLADALGLKEAGRMLKALRHAEQDQAAALLAPAVGQLLDRTLARPLVVDAEAHWKTVGWAAQALADCSLKQYIPATRPALEPNTVAYPAAVAWATAWLPRTDWSTAAAQESKDAFERNSLAHWHAEDTCMALVAASRNGLLPAGAPLATPWLTAPEAGPELLTLLCREAGRTPSIAAHVATPGALERMRRTAGEPGVTTLPCHGELTAALARIAPSDPLPATATPDELDL